MLCILNYACRRAPVSNFLHDSHLLGPLLQLSFCFSGFLYIWYGFCVFWTVSSPINWYLTNVWTYVPLQSYMFLAPQLNLRPTDLCHHPLGKFSIQWRKEVSLEWHQMSTINRFCDQLMPVLCRPSGSTGVQTMYHLPTVKSTRKMHTLALPLVIPHHWCHRIHKQFCH